MSHRREEFTRWRHHDILFCAISIALAGIHNDLWVPQELIILLLVCSSAENDSALSLCVGHFPNIVVVFLISTDRWAIASIQIWFLARNFRLKRPISNFQARNRFCHIITLSLWLHDLWTTGEIHAGKGCPFCSNTAQSTHSLWWHRYLSCFNRALNSFLCQRWHVVCVLTRIFFVSASHWLLPILR